MPVNVTNAYTEDHTNSAGCVPTLGQACVDAILSDGRIPGINSIKSCTTPGRPWDELPECQNTLGYAQAASGSFSIDSRGLSFGTQSRNALLLLEAHAFI
ncbi:hypothetical protein F4810DRAFT_664358 [Camillea tinctor]|nr:hypothetical protein F4810DRAFT_664358 [Camillea tinctor]